MCLDHTLSASGRKSLVGFGAEFDRDGFDASFKTEGRLVVADGDVLVGNGAELHDAGGMD